MDDCVILRSAYSAFLAPKLFLLANFAFITLGDFDPSFVQNGGIRIFVRKVLTRSAAAASMLVKLVNQCGNHC